MFTGIITSVGEIMAADRDADDLRLRIGCDYDPATIDIGASIACSGVCLTVVEKGGTDGACWFSADVSAETISKTTIGDRAVGDHLNLERSLKVGDELGGHIVSGHVDGVGRVVAMDADGESLRVAVEAPGQLAKFIAEKGSITMDGASLTVNDVDGAVFGVNLIPHTRLVTTFGELAAGRRVNLEIDLLARYVARLAEAQA